jgi:F-type H+-transporting ATPase subunit delta
VKTGGQAAARRMARALLEVAEKKGEAAAVQTGLRQVVAALHDLPELHSALSNPALSVDRRKRIVAAVFASTPALVRGFLELLVARELTSLLPHVERSYTAQWNARRGVVSAEAVTAVPLEEALVRALEQAIHKTTGLTAELSEKTDPAVMGGVLLKMGGHTYDGTVRGRLQALRRTLKGDTRS